MQTIYLSRRNLQVLLNKLDRNKEAGASVSQCTIIKVPNPTNYVQTMPECAVVAVEDEDYYTDRIEPGTMHPSDEPRKSFH